LSAAQRRFALEPDRRFDHIQIMSRFLARKPFWYWRLAGRRQPWLARPRDRHAGGGRHETGGRRRGGAIGGFRSHWARGSNARSGRTAADHRVYGGRDRDRGFDTLGTLCRACRSTSAGSASVLQMEKAYRGLSSINPRGLGSGRFLVLIDGHRPRPTPSTMAGARISISTASRWKRSTASNTRRMAHPRSTARRHHGCDEHQAEAGLPWGRHQSHGGQHAGSRHVYPQRQCAGSALATRADLTAGGCLWFRQNSNFIRDYNRSQTTDYSYLGPVKGSNQNSTANYPANVTLSAAQAATAAWPPAPVTTPSRVASRPPIRRRRCSRAMLRRRSPPTRIVTISARDYQLYPERENRSAFARLRHEVSDRLTGFRAVRLHG